MAAVISRLHWLRVGLFALACLAILPAYAHHVLGRPAYSLSEDSNTPPSMAIEAQIGDFFVTYMIFPAFPKPDEPGRINLYIQGIDEGVTFTGEVAFSVFDDSLFSFAEGSLFSFAEGSLFSFAEGSAFSAREEQLGIQPIDDGIYRQGFLFKEKGKYIIRAHFDHNNEPYDIDFPLQVGELSPIEPLALAALVLVITLLGANLSNGRRAQIAKFRMQNKRPVQ